MESIKQLSCPRWQKREHVLNGFDGIGTQSERIHNFGDRKANDCRSEADDQAKPDWVVIDRAGPAAACRGTSHNVFSDTPDRRQAQKSEYDGLDGGRHVPGPGNGSLERTTVELNCIERYRDVWLKPREMTVYGTAVSGRTEKDQKGAWDADGIGGGFGDDGLGLGRNGR
jgi:hypothetical protein